jgi:hypothetical protein
VCSVRPCPNCCAEGLLVLLLQQQIRRVHGVMLVMNTWLLLSDVLHDGVCSANSHTFCLKRNCNHSVLGKFEGVIVTPLVSASHKLRNHWKTTKRSKNCMKCILWLINVPRATGSAENVARCRELCELSTTGFYRAA